MDWRREDSAHAAATGVAAALVVYLLAANFGLVPTPFAPREVEERPFVVAPALVQVTGPGLTAPAPEAAAPPPAPAADASVPASTPPPDVTAPTAAFTTPNGLRVSGVTQGLEVRGTAADNQSGIGEVFVTFTASNGATTTADAHVSCTNPARTDCAWSAKIPAVLGTYSVTARVTDRAGNAAPAGPIEVTVVNVGGTVEDLTSDGLLGDVVGVVGGLLR